MADVRDRWAAGATYEEFMGRWSRLLAPRFVSWLQVPQGLHWLDVGCGTGALAKAIGEAAGPASVLGCDPAEPFVEFARRHSQDRRVAFAKAEVGSLPSRRGGFGCIASLLALNFFPDPAAAMGEMRSRAAPEGTVAACVWDYREGMESLRRFWDAACEVDATARELDEGVRFPLCQPGALVDLFRDAQLRDVACDPIEIVTRFSSFEDYWTPLLGGTGPAPSYVASLHDERRAALARSLEGTLPRNADGTMDLTARAWAIRGTV
jgi:SAM-dependent methyltransferase